jgi:hypothetical protein
VSTQICKRTVRLVEENSLVGIEGNSLEGFCWSEGAKYIHWNRATLFSPVLRNIAILPRFRFPNFLSTVPAPVLTLKF